MGSIVSRGSGSPMAVVDADILETTCGIDHVRIHGHMLPTEGIK